ncbi:MAG: molybdopterin-dependent oxidoreductase [Planctomycetales bacterium]|nr:molybdopterin-dependent oxidoreductase [Planctomycetales bacterium]
MPQTRETTCPLDCPDACSLQVELEDGRVVGIDGSADDPVTRGFICGKVRRFADHLYCDERVSQPMRRTRDKSDVTLTAAGPAYIAEHFEPISWDEAYSLIANRLRADRDTFGGESILPLCYGGSNGRLTQDSLDARLFYRLGASKLARTVCAAPAGAAFQGLYGKMPGVAFPDYASSDLIVVWGNNPHHSGVHLTPFIQQATRNGAALVVLDPRRTSLAAQADLHLPIYPGTDLCVALAMIHWLFENGHADHDFLEQHTSGHELLRARAAEWPVERAAEVSRIDEAALRSFFSLYAEATTPVVRCGWGPERNRNGGSAVAAILAIPAVANKFGRRGAGFTMSNSGAWQFDILRAAAEQPPNTRTVNMNLVGETLLHENDPPIRSLFIYNCNPVATLPAQNKLCAGLQREDLFTVVFDQVFTDSAMFADVILPATTFLEHDDLKCGYGYPRLGVVRPVVAPHGEAKPNNEVFGELLQRLGLAKEDDLCTPEQLQAALLGEQQASQLRDQGELEPACGLRPIQMLDVRPRTPSGKIEFAAESLTHSQAGLYCYVADEETPTNDSKRSPSSSYPLALISPSTGRTVNSTFGQLIEELAQVTVHPSDAEARGIEDGQHVRVFNPLGAVDLPAKVEDSVAVGVVSIPKGIWSRHTLNGQTSNALSPDTLSDIGAGACFNDARVEVQPLST